MLKKHQKSIYSVLIILFVISTNIFFATKAPSIHKNLIRNNIVGPKVVKIVNPNNHYSGGSGSHIIVSSGKTYILTNMHVCMLSVDSIVDVVLEGTTRFIPRRVIEIYKKHDLCLVEGIQGVKGIKLARKLEVGDDIAIVGHPRLAPLSISRGEFIGVKRVSVAYSNNIALILPEISSDLEKTINDLFKKFLPNKKGGFDFIIKTRNSLQLTAYSRGGSSGSPVINFYGEMVGVLYAGNRADAFDSYAVPLSFIKDFVSVY